MSYERFSSSGVYCYCGGADCYVAMYQLPGDDQIITSVCDTRDKLIKLLQDIESKGVDIGDAIDNIKQEMEWERRKKSLAEQNREREAGRKRYRDFVAKQRTAVAKVIRDIETNFGITPSYTDGGIIQYKLNGLYMQVRIEFDEQTLEVTNCSTYHDNGRYATSNADPCVVMRGLLQFALDDVTTTKELLSSVLHIGDKEHKTVNINFNAQDGTYPIIAVIAKEFATRDDDKLITFVFNLPLLDMKEILSENEYYELAYLGITDTRWTVDALGADLLYRIPQSVKRNLEAEYLEAWPEDTEEDGRMHRVLDACFGSYCVVGTIVSQSENCITFRINHVVQRFARDPIS